MSQYLVGVGRLALLLIPAVTGSRALRSVLLEPPTRSLRWLVDTVIAVSALVVGSETLGIASVNRWWTLTALLWVGALVAVASARRRRARDTTAAMPIPEQSGGPDERPSAPSGPLTPKRTSARGLQLTVAGAALAVVWGQWVLLTSDAYGGGIQSFDSLWYHLPFAAFFAQTGSVSRVLFTQADPFVAYYPANSELLHGVGMIAMRSDLLSPMLNLVWLAVALIAAWCFGRPWRIEPITLTLGCVMMGLPILGATQAGSAFSDIFGLAFLMAVVAMVVQPERRPGTLVIIGLALGLAAGAKVTFAAPAAVIVVGAAFLSPAGRRLRTFAILGLAGLLTAGWWYLRATLDTGSPLGLRVHIGPLVLAGPNSPLANGVSQTVISALAKPHLWGSRLAPGLNYAIGPLWPLLLLAAAVGLIAGVGLRPALAPLRVIAIAGVVAVVAYLVFPTGAAAIEQQTQLFAVNLRYLIPALTIGLFIGVAIVAERLPRLLALLPPILLTVLAVTQLQGQLWPTQTARHAVFLLAAGVALAVAFAAVRLRLGARGAVAGLVGLGVLIVIGGFAVDRHYFARRYVSAADSATPLGRIYRWAQGISSARVALYGTVEQYPLYGARVTNSVDYLGQPARDGGYGPIATCGAWRMTLRRGRFQYLVITPAPTAPVPAAWTAGDAAAIRILNPAPGFSVYRLAHSSPSSPC